MTRSIIRRACSASTFPLKGALKSDEVHTQLLALSAVYCTPRERLPSVRSLRVQVLSECVFSVRHVAHLLGARTSASAAAGQRTEDERAAREVQARRIAPSRVRSHPPHQEPLCAGR